MGPDESETSFAIHQKLACAASGFFEAALRNGWKESQDKVVRLLNHDAKHFQLFFLWLYSGNVFSLETKGDANTGPDDSEWDLLANSWALATYLQARRFGNTVSDATNDKISTATDGAHQTMHKIVYPGSSTGAPIRKLLVATAVWCWKSEFYTSLENDPAWSDFFVDLTGELSKNRDRKTDRPAPFLTNWSAYHDSPSLSDKVETSSEN